MNSIELIREKRNGGKLNKEEIDFLIQGYSSGSIPDYQFSAFLMAVYLNGCDKEETAHITDSMLHSGKVVDLSSIPGKKVDKHSTGGVGDKTSLILAPIAAAAGVKVPMISGRGLGHSGGTLDKLESIPGFRTDLELDEYLRVIRECGAVLIGQTAEIAPADKKIYALRDVTATVESIPLITGSIMSKKLAEGIDGLVLDIKTGSGAFMKTIDEAEKLGNSLVDTAKRFRKSVIGFITDMNQPLGNFIGNWLEIVESVEVLRGKDVPDLVDVTLHLSGAMIYLADLAGSIEEGIEISGKMISSGAAYDKFLEMVEIQGGDTGLIANISNYPKSKYHEKIYTENSGFLAGVDNYSIGMSALQLGAGRMTKEDIIDPKAGMIFHVKIGDRLKSGDLIAEIYTDKENQIEAVKGRILNSLNYSSSAVEKPELIKQTLM